MHCIKEWLIANISEETNMEYTFTVNLIFLSLMAFFVIVFYIYIKDNGDDRLTQMRHDVEMRKEWFRMLANQKTNKSKWPEGWN